MEAAGTWQVHALSRSPKPVEREGLVWHTLDPLDSTQLRRVFEDVNPRAVIHTAAMADIDSCEVHKESADRVNVELTRDLAELCREHGARTVFLSSDNVFDGARGLYTEEDAPSPINYYAETKARAERIVVETVSEGVVARVSVVMGLPALGTGNSFLSRMLPALREGSELGVPEDEIRTPIDVITLGKALLELAGNNFEGTIHLAGNDVLNRLEMVRRIAAKLGYTRPRVVPFDPRGLPGRAPRPKDVSLDNRKARALLKTPMRGLEDGLDLILAGQGGRLT